MSALPFTFDDIIGTIKKHVTDEVAVQKIARDLQAIKREVEQNKPDKSEKTGKERKFVVFLRGDEALKKAISGQGAWILNCPDDETSNTYSADGLVERLKKAARYSNDNPPKTRRKPFSIKTFVQLFEYLKPRSIKDSESDFKIKTKLPVELIVLDKESIE